MKNQKSIRFLKLTMLVVLITIAGCQRKQVELPPKAPRPVTTMELKQIVPASSYHVSGSVQSWKIEQMGFEVAGRLQWVLEPGKNIVGQVHESGGKLLNQGTALAKIDPARHEVAVESAKAALEVAELDKEVIEIRLTDAIPQDIQSAEADAKLAQVDVDRMAALKRENAISQSEYDDAANRLQTQQARLSNLKSSLKQAAAELKASEARIKSARQFLNDAERDLANTILYASFPKGQISEVQVVPGSVVSAGSPILTLQMMDPIKVEVEVSAEQSRELQRRRQVPVTFALPDGSTKEQKAMVYLVDPSADPSTRTFTVTLLVINEQYRQALPEELQNHPLARTQNVWPINVGQIVGSENGMFVVEENAIETDGNSSYVWVFKDIMFGDTMPESVKVRKVEVQPSEIRVPFLGNWVFRQVTFLDDSIQPTNLIAGKLEFPDNERVEWDGETLFVDSGQQWMLRPGDLVDVNLNPEMSQPGYFVPVEAIYEDLGSTYVFMVKGNTARKTKVDAILPTKLDAGSLIRIEPGVNSSFAEGDQIVVGGVHYLNDGDEINVVGSTDGNGGGQ